MIKILYFLHQLPQNIIGLVMWPFLGKKTKIRTENYTTAYECENMSGGISLGSFIFLSPYSAKKETTIMHEFGHSIDSHKFGWLYLFIIGLPSILNAALSFTDCYYDFYTEKRANDNAGLGVDENCRLYKK